MVKEVGTGQEPAANEVVITPKDDLPDTAKGVAGEARDLKALRAVVVDAASVSGALWISYLFVLFYLLVAVGAVTHQDLFFERGVKLPFLSIDLPLTGFFVLGPLIFVIVHAYVLLHFVLLSGKVGEFDRELRAQITDEETRTQIRRQLPSNIFVQFLAGPREIRAGVTGLMLKLIAWISLVVGPVVLLVFLQLRFLPYHDEAITWWHRVAVLIEIVMLWTLWPAVARGETVRAPWRGLRLGTIPAIVISLLPLALCFGIATFPGEWLHKTLPSVRFVPATIAVTISGQVRKNSAEDEGAELDRARSLHELLMAGDLNEVARQPTSPFSNVLLLPNIDGFDRSRFDDDTKFAAVRETIALRGRRLEGALLLDANLRKADLTGARLQGARLDRADLRDARLSCAHRQGAQFGYDDQDCTQLQEASLNETRIEGALLDNARLQGAVLTNARLQGASLNDTQLQGARLDYASLLGAVLVRANLQGASLFGAQLDGASLDGAMLEAASLKNASLAGASLSDARLDGTDLSLARLAGINLDRAVLTGGDFWEACLWRAQVAGSQGADSARMTNLRLTVSAVPTSPPPDGVCDWSEEQFHALVARIGTEVPRQQREERVKAVSARLDPTVQLKEEVEIATAWQNFASHSPSEEAFETARVATWRAVGCEGDNASYVLSSMVSQFISRGGPSWQVTLARLFLDPVQCPPATQLSGQAVLKLRAMAARMR